MSELFDDEDKELNVEDDFVESEDLVLDASSNDSTADARRRLENLLDEKRLRDELDDFLDY